MKIAPVLLMALKELERVLQGSLSGKQVDNIVSKINAFAIYSAIAGTASVYVASHSVQVKVLMPSPSQVGSAVTVPLFQM